MSAVLNVRGPLKWALAATVSGEQLKTAGEDKNHKKAIPHAPENRLQKASTQLGRALPFIHPRSHLGVVSRNGELEMNRGIRTDQAPYD